MNWTCILEVLDSNFDQETSYLEIFRGFTQSLKATPSIVL
jgi:hypothetical protein